MYKKKSLARKKHAKKPVKMRLLCVSRNNQPVF